MQKNNVGVIRVLNGKKAIVTGASYGLGAVCAKALALEGVSMVLIARTKQKLEEVRQNCKNPDNHLTVEADLTDIAQLKDAIKTSVDFLGDVDIILHVAGGGLGLRDPLLNAEGMEKLFQLNMFAAAEINTLVIPEMLKKRKGNVVHICSIASSEATGSVGYNTAKAALAAYVRTLGREVAGSGVVVTGILPGGFFAQGNSWARLQNKKPDIVKRFVEENLPRKFLGKAEELVPMILLLCSESASMMGGCLVPIDAGEGKSYLQ